MNFDSQQFVRPFQEIWESCAVEGEESWDQFPESDQQVLEFPAQSLPSNIFPDFVQSPSPSFGGILECPAGGTELAPVDTCLSTALNTFAPSPSVTDQSFVGLPARQAANMRVARRFVPRTCTVANK